MDRDGDFEKIVQLWEKKGRELEDWKMEPVVVIGHIIPNRMKRICPYFILCQSAGCAFRSPKRTQCKLMYCKRIPKEFEYRGYIPEETRFYEDMTLFELVDVED